jgi:hypothetical protein
VFVYILALIYLIVRFLGEETTIEEEITVISVTVTEPDTQLHIARQR